MRFFFIATITVNWEAIGYSLLGFIGGFLSGAVLGRRSSRGPK